MGVIPCSIRAVTFDVGGTLIACRPSVGHIYARVAARHEGKRFEPAVLNRRFADAWKAAKDFRHSRLEWTALVDATFRGLTSKPPSQTFFPELYALFAQPQAWRVFPDVGPALERLATHGLKLGIVSNWDHRLLPLLEALDLRRRFDAVTVSCEAGSTKPEAAIFQVAAARLGVAPGQVLHVGDDPVKDVRGARAAGLQAFLLQRRGRVRPPGALRSLRGLPGLFPKHI